MFKIINLFILTIFIAVEGHIHFPIVEDAANNVPNKTETKIQYRLPGTAIPIDYIIQLTPDLDETSKKNFTFEGIVDIKIQVKEESDNVTLHSKNLDILKATLISPGATYETNVQLEPERDFLIITKKGGKISAGEHTLLIIYSGILNNNMRGFYRSSYENNGKKVWLATTHFEPVGARLAFPCFDEPKYKATFNLKIVHDKKYKAISNTKEDTSTPEKIVDKIVTKFSKTPKMSTYLVAFVVSDFELLENKAHTFRVYARPNAIAHGQLALEAGEALLNELDKFTGIKFSSSINKMDQAAIPDFAAGAMENWGLVLYREKSLLYDDKTLTTSEKQNIVETIAHEFAHQWFGDLVSPDWWKYIWLNEGFANFFQSYITEKVKDYAEWRSVDQSVVKSIQTTAFDFDSGPTTHPIIQDVESPKEISAIFDSISYQKGGAVIRMMQHFLTETVFQTGLQKYLDKYKEKVATSDNLFDVIQEVVTKLNSTLKVKDIMKSWVEHKGYPVVTVTRNYNNTNKNAVAFKQERFFSYNASETEINDKHTWQIPINYVTQAEVDFKDTKPVNWLDKASKNIEINVDDKHWLIVNKQQTGFYRVNYDEKNWELIISYLNSPNRDKIHLLNRAQLINDALAFTKQEKLNLLTLLHLTAHLKNETDYIPWYPGFKTFSWLNAKLTNTKHYPIFKKYVLETTKTLVSHVGLEEKKNDTHLDKLNRITALNWICTLGDTTCTTEMNTKLVQFLNGTTKDIMPDFKQVTLCHGLRKANFEDWEKVLQKYESSKDSVEKGYLITALGCSTNKTILETYLNKSVVDNSSLNDAIAVINSVRDNSDIGVEVALDFVVKRFISIREKVQKLDEITNVFTGIGQKITTDSLLKKLEATEKTDIPRKVFVKGIESAKKNIEWLEKNNKELLSWIEELKPPPTNGVGIFSASLSLISSLLIVIIITVK